jgi:hypothetical protein
MEWQPIETAPKDGVWILVSCPEKIGNVQGTGMAIARAAPHELSGWEMDNYDSLGWTPLFNAPTHWMPLPEPPDNTTARKEG